MQSRRRLEVLFSFCLVALLAGACSGDTSPEQPDSGLSPDAAAVDSGAVDLAAEARTGTDLGVPADLSPEVSPDAATPGLPALGQLTMFINLGDSIAAGQGVAKSYATLLAKNDDQAYPDFAGKDLATKYPALQLADRAVPGARSASVINQAAKAPDNPQGNTLVVLSIGGNDLLDNAMALMDAAQTKQIAQTVAANVDKALAVFDDKSRYPGEVFVLALNVYEMTDDQGTIPADEPVDFACGQLRSLGSLFGKTMVQNFDVFNGVLEAAFAQRGVTLIDVRQAFLGHGFNYKDASLPDHDASDPTLWLQYDCIHPNQPGHAAIRRLIWSRLFGD